ncbi:hypothetical protein OH76DRAFT_1487046 [Lentinus brumalis]|uniref:F-box domain-containing protein n=1 Tax=Lentinus brumalis TaxID=2498619 RepID=A0A371CVZ6_9APHY|nr:hypothetical protein OH76DRAFT_1487046 [Polyporus brumalis]
MADADISDGLYVATRRAIHRLPAEILVEIFRNVQTGPMSTWKQSRKPRPWYSLLRVCKQWSNVVRSSPALWRVIFLTGRPDVLMLKYSLTYSGDMPVDLVVDSIHNSFATLTPLIAPHACRIRSLQFSELNTITDHALASLLYHRMPQLEELSLAFCSEGHDGKDEELEPLVPDQNEDEDGEPIRFPFFWFPKADQFPRIVNLQLGRSVAFSLRFPVLPSLRHLELRGCIVLGDLTIVDFVQYLAQHPVLERLSLSRFNVTLADGASLRLPGTLRRLELEDYPLRIAGFLSKLAPLPADLDVRLYRRLRYVDSDPETPSTAVHSLPEDRSILPILTLVETITRDAFGGAPVTELRVEGHEDHKFTEEQWRQALLAFPRPRKIAVTDTSAEEDSDASIALVKALRAPDPMVDGMLLCSHLKELELAAMERARDAELAKEIAACLTLRKTLGVPLESLLVYLKTTWHTKKATPDHFQKREELYTSVIRPLIDELRFEHEPCGEVMVAEETCEDSEPASGSESTDHASDSDVSKSEEVEGTNSDAESD